MHKEVYTCLFCRAQFVGDDAWYRHLRSTEHGVAYQELTNKLNEPIEWPQPIRTEQHLD